MPRTEKIKPAKCDGCDKEIAGGFIAFICKSHCICMDCLKTMPRMVPDWTSQEGMCPYCTMEGASLIEKTEFRYPLPKNTPKSVKHETNIKLLEDNPFCGWSTPYDDAVAVGKGYPAIVDIVNVNGTIVSHKLPRGVRVLSGLYLDTEKCLISATGDFVYTCNIHPRDTISSNPNIITTLSLHDTVKVFPMINFRYGILCKKPSRIEIFSKRSIYTEENPKPKQTLTIGIPELSDLDDACCTPSDQICVSRYNPDKVHIFDNTGVCVNVIGEKSTLDTTIPGYVSGPLSVETTEDGSLVVTGYWGDIHVYRNGKGLQLAKKGDRDKAGDSRAGVLSDTRVWIIRHVTDSVDVYKMIY